MDTFRFRNFEVYHDAKKFRTLVRSIIATFPNDERFQLTDQISRACLSIILNIAEGSAKNSDKDFARFLETSIASVNEVIAGFDIALDDGLINQEQFNQIELSAKSIANQLGGFRKKLLS